MILETKLDQADSILPPTNQVIRPYLEGIGITLKENDGEFSLEDGSSKLSRAEMAGVLSACDRINAAKNLSEDVKKELISGLLDSVFLVNNSQGNNWSTCKAAALLTKLAIEDPARFARIAADLVTEGKSKEGLVSSIPISEFAKNKGEGALTQDRSLVQSVMQASLMDAMNSSWTVALDDNGDLISVRTVPTNDSLPDSFSGGLDHWTENGYRILFGSGQVKYIDDKNEIRRSLISGELNRQSCSIKLSEYQFHALLIENVIHDGNEYRVIFRDSMFHGDAEDFANGPGKVFKSSRLEGGSCWSMSLSEAVEGGLNWVVTKDNYRDSQLSIDNGDRSYNTYIKYLENNKTSLPTLFPNAEQLLMMAMMELDEGSKRKQKEQLFSSKN